MTNHDYTVALFVSAAAAYLYGLGALCLAIEQVNERHGRACLIALGALCVLLAAAMTLVLALHRAGLVPR